MSSKNSRNTQQEGLNFACLRRFWKPEVSGEVLEEEEAIEQEGTGATESTRPSTRSQGLVRGRPSLEGMSVHERRNLEWGLRESRSNEESKSSEENSRTGGNLSIGPMSPRREEMDRANVAVPLSSTLFDEFIFTSIEAKVYEEPKSFNEAWNHPDEVQREKWREAIRKEFQDMKRRGVWKVIPRTEMPSGRRCVKHKWVFTIKRDGRFRARLVACGYSQIPGVDYTENYSPVIHDVTYRILIILQIVFGLESMIMDVETAFLHGDLSEEIYMDCPEGMEDGGPFKCVKLEKTIYGLVQSARQFFKKLVQKLNDIGFKQSEADPCLMTWESPYGIVYVATYVDDCYCVGTRKALLKLVEMMRVQTKNVEPFSLTTTEGTSDYLSCEIVFSSDRKKAWLGQPHLIANLRKVFGKYVEGLQVYRTPGTPSTGLKRIGKNIEEVPKDQHSLYRSGVGMLLYLVKHSRPDIANCVREMSKLLDCPTHAALKELKRCVKFVLDTSDYGLKIEPNHLTEERWTLKAYSDSDWAGDSDTRISVSGFIIYLMGVPVSWRSRQQRSVVLSSSEAEFVALSEAAKEIKFIYQILASMGLKVQTPIKVYVDNVGAMFMSENMTTSQRTRHVDIRYHYVREFVDENFLKIVFVKTENNVSDGFTKNLSGELYDKHTPHHVVRKSYVMENTDNTG